MSYASGSRLPIALHIPQELLPPSGAGSLANGPGKAPSKVIGSGSGYGPPLAPEGTPLSRLVSATLYLPAAEPTPSEAAQGWTGAGGKTEYDLVCMPLTNGNWQERWEGMCTITASATEAELGVAAALASQQSEAGRAEAEAWRAGGGFRRNEVNLTRSEEAGSLMVFASEWLELDSPVEGIRFDSELALRQEIAYASYLSLTTIILPPPRLENREYLADYARAVNSALASSWHIHISIRIPVAEYTAAQLAARPATPAPGASMAAEDRCETWEAWNTIRQLCGYSPRLTLTLDVTNPLPSAVSLGRWTAEPLKHIFLPCTTFIPNAKGYPVLSKSMQAFLKGIFKFNPTVILSGTHRGLHTMGGPLAYAQYVRHTHRKSAPLDPVEQYAQGYMDHLQQPLQPLMDNLEGETYEGFEKDPIKYRQYEEAVYQALMDRSDKVPITLFVVGAGRGPLVAGCLRAAERSRRKLIITAVEKNPSAFVILQERVALEWGNSVKLVFSDMRSFYPRDKADIIVSELLGSFGDNELSPECLDGVMRCLKPDGISIPSSYTSYLAPITSSKLHAEVTVPTAAGATTISDAKPAEQPYVVMFSAAHTLSAPGGRLGAEKIQECWTFDHPRPDVVVDSQGLPYTNHHNARSTHLTFHIPRAGVCHGFAGYFEAVLYGDVGLSIHPERAAGDMLSWFPIFFPLMDPIYLPANSELDVQMWRMTDGVKRRVWFEWAASAYLCASALSFPPTSSPRHSVTSPPASSNSGTFAPAGRQGGQHASADTLSPRGGPWDQQGGAGGGGRNSYQSSVRSPMVDAFQSAPSPMIGGPAGQDRRDSGRMQGIEEEDGSQVGAAEARILIYSSKLHNPGGKSSYVGL
ncbi:PRMT5 arginine-N-methyltransferase-domain-containing protein [Leucosporidium creatinivorum]|uniref:PRMT5 arginine-N-methyltransferase-domain-containing protein n=1 Tax=Leucosporidium creatinivorum TaxID=106004 RepID=A0A1Y2FEF4_9BASI|nr:PRMT5 arginine-N-methyltransferase-domain-containing protein [Leucosporidium creatinivorum]